MSSRNGRRAGPRLKDMTPTDILVLADKAKEQGLGVTPVDPNGRVQLAYLCYCPEGLEEAFAQVFPHQPAEVRAFNNYRGRSTYLFEESAVLAVLAAFGLDPARRERHVRRWMANTYVRVVRRRARPARTT